MNVQIKRGILDYLVLAILKDEDYYGYILLNEVSKYINVSDFALYPILRRLEKDHCLSSYSRNYNGRIRKYYSITPLGLEKLKEAKSDWEIIKNVFLKINGI